MPLFFVRVRSMCKAIKDGWFNLVQDDLGCAFAVRVSERLEKVRSEYQKIEIFKSEQFGTLMALDGSLVLNGRDSFLYHEMISHPAIFAHPRPRRICIVGGGNCGVLREVLRHPEISQVVQIELDDQITRLTQKYFPELHAATEDPRATLTFGDAIKWMKKAQDGCFDLIIIDAASALRKKCGALNQKFFEQCQRVLSSGGILVQHTASPLLHLDALTQVRVSLLQAGFADLRTLSLPQAASTASGSCTMARKDIAFNKFREQAVFEKVFETRYYNAEVHNGATALPNYVKQAFRAAGAC